MKVQWRLMGIAIGVAAMIIISLQTQVAYSTAKNTAKQVQDCQREFNLIIRTRAAISEDNDKWSVIQRTALGDWLKEIIEPPPDIAQIQKDNPTDPRITAWGIAMSQKYSNIIQNAQREQDINFEERKQHPLPDPTCGK